MAEEEKRVPNYNPEEDDKEYIGTKLLDSIERGVGNWYQDERTLEGWEYLNPISVATATAIRGVEGVGWVLGNTPGASQLLQGIGWAEDRLAEGARNISGALTPDLDPRFAGWGSRLATAILADKGLRKANVAGKLSKGYSKVKGAVKETIEEGAERATVRSGKKYTSTRPETMSDVWRDDLDGPRKTYERYNKKRYYPNYPPDDPWMSPEDIARRDEIRSDVMKRMTMAIDETDYFLPNLGKFDVKNFKGKAGGMVDKYLSQQGSIKDIQDIVDAMDTWRIQHAGKERPMTGFTKHFGRNPTIIIDGQEHVIGWSRKANNRKGGYTIRNLEKHKAVQRSRIEKNLTSNASEAEKSKIQELIKRDINFKSKTLDPDQWDLLIQNPGDAYREHWISVKSPFWNSKRGKNAGYKAGDLRNMKILGDQNFKSLKDRIETRVHSKHKDLYVDYDHSTQNLILRDLKTGKALPTQIPGYGKAAQWETYLDDALNSRPMKAIENVYSPEDVAPANISRQLNKEVKPEVPIVPPKPSQREQTLAKDAAEVQEDVEKVYKFISSKEKEFRGTYPLGMEDLDLLDDATEIVQDINRNRALRENIQGTIFDKQNEAAQIEAMKKILLDRSRRK